MSLSPCGPLVDLQLLGPSAHCPRPHVMNVMGVMEGGGMAWHGIWGPEAKCHCLTRGLLFVINVMDAMDGDEW